MSVSMDRPRHPAFWRFTGVGVDGGGFSVFCASARARLRRRACRTGRTLVTPAVSLPAALGVDVVLAEREAREVAVPCERMEERPKTAVVVDWTELRAEGWCERGGGGYGCEVAMAAAEGGMGGVARCVLLKEREELLAEGGVGGPGSPHWSRRGRVDTPATRNRPRRFEAGKPDAGVAWADALRVGGDSSDCCLTATVSAGSPPDGGFWGQGGRAIWGTKEGAETVSKDSSRLSPTSVPVPTEPRTMWNACSTMAPTCAESPPSEESAAEWKDEGGHVPLDTSCAVGCGEVGGC